MRLRVVTYNIHKSRGLDFRIRPDRILGVLAATRPDVVALQEVLSQPGAPPELDQAGYFARQLGLQLVVGENRRHLGAAYGNATLSRFPLRYCSNFDLSVAGREKRGCVLTEVLLDRGDRLYIFNVHLGTSNFERRNQANLLVRHLEETRGWGSRIVLGDFNEWYPGLTSRLLADHFRSVDIRIHLKRRRTYPGLLPMLHLDHLYYDGDLDLESATLYSKSPATVASDHLPIVADFVLGGESAGGQAALLR